MLELKFVFIARNKQDFLKCFREIKNNNPMKDLKKTSLYIKILNITFLYQIKRYYIMLFSHMAVNKYIKCRKLGKSNYLF